MTVNDLYDIMFRQFPKGVRWLLKLRDMIVKPFGLKTGISFDDKIKEQNTNEIILGAEDKHLTFYISLFLIVFERKGGIIPVYTEQRKQKWYECKLYTSIPSVL